MAGQGAGAHPAPGKSLTLSTGTGTGTAPVAKTDPHAFVEVLVRRRRGRLDDEGAGRPHDPGDPQQQRRGIPADPHIPVDEQRGPPAALTRQRLEDRADQRGAPDRRARLTASALTSMPSAGRPSSARAATRRPGPQPMSSTDPRQRASTVRSAASARAHQRSTSSGSSRPSARWRKSGPRPVRSARVYGSALHRSAGLAEGSADRVTRSGTLTGPPPASAGPARRRTGCAAPAPRPVPRPPRCPRPAAAAAPVR